MAQYTYSPAKGFSANDKPEPKVPSATVVPAGYQIDERAPAYERETITGGGVKKVHPPEQQITKRVM